MTEAAALLEVRALTKRFPGVTALDAVDLDVQRGETHALLGENGAGKSTLVQVLAGIHAPDAGHVSLGGAPFSPATPRDAIRAGVRLIHQEINLLENLTVAENIFFERLPRRFGVVDYAALNARARDLLAQVGLDVPPDTPVENLSVAQMQMVEIVKALSSDSRLLIMDEPTASLTDHEIGRLFAIIRDLKARGVTIIYISHRLQEVFEICDRFTVLRNGKMVATRPVAGTRVADVVRLMVGRDIAEAYPFRDDVRPGPEVFRVEELRPRQGSLGISFSLRTGELLGFAGLVGSGRTAVLRAIFGADDKAAGRLWVEGRQVRVRHPRDAVRHGISLLTENRKEEGLVLDMPIHPNVTLTDLAAVSRNGLIQSGPERSAARDLVDDLDIRTAGIDQLVRNLSGGNQQKVVLAKWLFRNSRVLMVDEPTRGVDVGARYEIYQLLWELAAAGKAILMVSSDLPELIGLCHRILVFSDGEVTGELSRDEFDQERILSLAYQEYVRGGNQAA